MTAAVLLLSMAACLCFAEEEAVIDLDCPSAILMERSTGNILYEKDALTKRPMASVTKIMTLLLIMEAIENKQLSYETQVTCSEYAASMGGSQVYLKEGESMSVNDMLKAICVASGNDASVAMAEAVAGSDKAFVARMNERAKELGMENTHFVNCTGLDADDHYSCANDIAVMSRQLLSHEKIKEYTTIWMDSLRDGAFGLSNTNKLVRFYQGCTGLKTGSTSKALYCMSASAERDGMELIAVVLASPTSPKRFEDAKKLLNYGFAGYEILEKEIKIPSQISLINGKDKYIEISTDRKVSMLVKKGTAGQVNIVPNIQESVTAPASKGDKVGQVDLVAGEKIIKINIEEEMKSSYIDYSMSVIVSRALPDVRDGLKPVHRRVLFGMDELGLTSGKPYKKSARIVGEVLGKYHPHGDSSVYMAMVRMAQEWSLRYPLVDGQGNFGSVDGDSPAAMRYTEARMAKITEDMLVDIDKDTVDMMDNFDGSLKEPTVLPTRIPYLLVNGASGIAVGMATNMPPHNIKDAIDAICAYIDNNDIDIEELIKIIKAPDFPTGGTIYGYSGVRESYLTGRGRVVIRPKTSVEVMPNGREKLIVHEIPYMVNKAELISRIADLINEKKIDGISNINDESDREGMRIVIDIKKDAISNVVLNTLLKHTALQSSFGVNNVALVHGRPRLLNLKDIIRYFVEHRHDVVVRRTQFELRKAEERAHILEGLIIASDHIDEVIRLIRASKTPQDAQAALMDAFSLTDKQAAAIVAMRLGQLTGLEQDKLRAEYEDIEKLIAHLNDVLAHVELRMEIIKNELLAVKAQYGDDRRTDIVYASEEFNPEDFYADEEMVITISHMGYIKRTPLSEYKVQNRGGVGSKGSATRDEDFLEHMIMATMHNTMLFFTEKGKCFWLKVYEIPEGTKQSKGRAIQNLLNIEPDDKVKAYINLLDLKDYDYINSNYIVLCTKKGIIKKTTLEAYSRPRQNGVNAITIKEGDQLLEAKLTNGENDIMIAVKSGKAIRFPESKVRPMGRTASGVRGIWMDDDDEAIGMVCVEPNNANILVVSENGFGKRSAIEDYRITNRGGKGVKTINMTEKTGNLIALIDVTDEDNLMIINRSGLTIRLEVSSLRVMGRNTQGVKLINLRNEDSIAAVAKVSAAKEEENSEVVAEEERGEAEPNEQSEENV